MSKNVRLLELLPLLPLLLSLCPIMGLSLPNGTVVASLGDGNVAGNVNQPALGAGLGSSGNNSSSSGGAGGGVNLPIGSGGSQSNSEPSGGIGGNSLGINAVGSNSNSGGGGSSSGSGNNSALMQPAKEKQYDKCTGPGDPGPCKQYIYKWRFEPTTSECTTFIWGGCDGNPQNRFSTETECLFHCIGGPRKRIILVNPLMSLKQKNLSTADTLPPFLQSTTREPSTTESSLAIYTQSPAQSPVGFSGNIGGAPPQCPSSSVDPN